MIKPTSVKRLPVFFASTALCIAALAIVLATTLGASASAKKRNAASNEIIDVRAFEARGFVAHTVRQKPAPLEIIDDSGRTVFTYRRAADASFSGNGIVVKFSLQQLLEAKYIGRNRGPVTGGVPIEFREGLASTLPMLEYTSTSLSKGGAYVRFFGPFEKGSLSLNTKWPEPASNRGFRVSPDQPASTFEPMLTDLEPLVRGSAARLVGERAEITSIEQRRIGGVAQFHCALSEASWFDLDDWAAARGWAVGRPDSVPSVTLAKEGREILLPLAAMQARIDGEWRELGDCVAEKDGRWLVPATIDSLAR